MPLRGDYRLKAVAQAAGVCERTARRWRDQRDDRWERYLGQAVPPFASLSVPDITPAPEPDLDGLGKILEEDDAGNWKRPATFTREDATLALDWMRAYTFRLTTLLAGDPPPFDKLGPRDWEQADKAGKIFKRLAEKYHGGPLKRPD